MSTLLEMATEIVTAHASKSPMSKEDLITEISDVYKALSAIEKGETPEVAAEEETAPAISKRKAFGKKQIICMICGKGMKTLARHLKTAHEMTAKEYRKQFDIPRTQALAARDYSESRRNMAIEKDLGAGLAKARAARAGKKK
ncbi:MAG: MucR family transcriptional regulator [Desulfuromonas sp.]|uniref:MucR family transcriptional regulator n=1 Tax=Desulfuromonas sp. TaxID=892 RepID=UPI000CB7B711|nr:MucR family transcriptional regulator [Desulfuromonas sp.]PLX83666.1 MAG: MucR family transcriptional regulator [Desulfuromonas sp.]